MPNIFISYRRVDSSERTYRVADWLTLKYGKSSVFVDIDRINKGADFAQVLQEQVRISDVLLVIIGEKWLDEFERRKDARDKDYVYKEVYEGLNHIPLVIPVLLENTQGFSSSDLPDGIQQLASLNFARVRGGRDFHRDMDDVHDSIKEAFPQRRTGGIIVTAIVFVMVIAVAGGIFLNSQGGIGNLFGNPLGGSQLTDTGNTSTEIAESELITPSRSDTPEPNLTDTEQPSPETLLPTDTTVPTPLPTDTTVPTPLPTNTTVPTPLPTNTTVPTPLPTNTTIPTPLPTDTDVSISSGTLTVASTSITNYDLFSSAETTTRLIYNNLFDRLIDIAPDGTYQARLATSWSVDGNSVSFNLRQNVTFHNGAPLTSRDVQYSYERLAEARGIELEITIFDDYTIGFQIPQNDSAFFTDVIAHPNAYIVSSSNPPDLQNGNAIGTGAFTLVSIAPSEQVTLTSNTAYWGDVAGVETLNFVLIDDEDTRRFALDSGQVDVALDISYESILLRSQEGNQQLLRVPGNQYPGLRIQAGTGSPGEDSRIRQAFKYATNRELINQILMDGLGFVGNNDPIGPAYASVYTSNSNTIPYDPEVACALINEAGYSRLSIELNVSEALNHPELGEILQAMWEDACIDADLLILPQAVYFGGDNIWLEADLAITGWGNRLSPQSYLEAAHITASPWNEAQYSNPELDALVGQLNSIFSIDTQADIYTAIADIFAVDGSLIVPFFYPELALTNDNVQNLTIHSTLSLTHFRDVTISDN